MDRGQADPLYDSGKFARLMLEEIANLFTRWYAFLEGHLSRVDPLVTPSEIALR
jgi:hypothetical protein